MSIAGLLSLLFACVTVLLLVLYVLQRRDLRQLAELSQQLQRIAIGGRLPVSIPGIASRGGGLDRPAQSASGGLSHAQP